VGSGVTLSTGVGVGVAGFGVGFFVGFGVGFGVLAGAQPRTPLDVAGFEEPFGVWYLSLGSVPEGGNRAADRARIRLRTGSWMEPRSSNPDLTSGWVMTAR
jgi:hypothetical protein